jgi:hypothetical protein
MGRFFVFPILAVAFNIQNPSFVPTKFMTLFVGTLSQFRFFQKTLFEIMPVFTARGLPVSPM